MPGGFTFNQILVVDDQSLLFHTGPRKLFPLVREAVQHVLGDMKKLRWVGLSHVEADECGSINDWLAAAPEAQPVCGRIAAMVSIGDLADRAPRGLADGEVLSLGKKQLRWLDAPHVPHGWDCGYFFESTTSTLLCGDLLTQPGADLAPLTESDVLGPAEGMRKAMSYFAIERDTRTILEKLAATAPRTLATMHGSSFRGDGRKMLLELAGALGV
jgi:flavorubredoxin